MAKQPKQDVFTRFTSRVSEILGRAWVFAIAIALLLIWALSGPVLGYSDTWQLVINTSTTIITFLMVFIIQNTQNRDNLAMNIKLDRILEAHGIDEQDIIVAETKSDKRLEREQRRAQERARRDRKKSSRR